MPNTSVPPWIYYGKFKQMSEILDYAGFYFIERVIVWDPQACEKHLPSNHPLILNLQKALSALETFSAEAIQATFKSVAAELGVKVGQLVHPVRLAARVRPKDPACMIDGDPARSVSWQMWIGIEANAWILRAKTTKIGDP